MASDLAGRGGLVARLAKASALIGVALVFVANFMNDHFVAALQEDTQNVDAVQGDAAQAKDASTSGLDQLEAAERISRLEVNLAGVTSRSGAEEAQSIIDSFSLYFSTLESSVAMLNDSLQQVRTIPDRDVALSDDTTQAIETVGDEVAAMSEAVANGTRELAALKAELESAESEEAAAAAANAITERFAELDALEARYREISTEINGLFDSIAEQVGAEQEASQGAAGVVGALVYVLSAIGGAIAWCGNWLGRRVTPESAAATV